jgi:hypothetical protein
MSNITQNQKVVCVDDSFDPAARAWFSSLPVKGRVYNVRLAYQNVTNGCPTLLLTGIQGASPAPHRHEIGFRAARFRTLAEMRAMDAIKQGATAEA